ncbi:sugar/nucleoside kinase (ribokinase family) [Parabacteroides sp. PF5-5]|uniref:PfkB family carbohydrate kinase n=1 Tax=unclassified Parabacteroides TaxID=2649774 RepID=UPI002473DFD8|nr:MULTISPECIES: PfkB family carbohydrate kinase [unclassified Parabacteroides]MDH6304459.1 sugar/nucleoside kinase (ribokinase family) [Parabacteroides sp. PH5-39]MDH6315388.1 sugar/nucleoside kinase (ribokinase family) [Parabacteroides sp. PF5-13]MDH6319118.1 sugar/nucleoside kinase (ribokinase family) [Parabacteroides sp. PH5-13]MDH6322848.1 sugar/nucleoside kinase (ribokinase family) [Parabacteroides sp. PH5-8]MDH6326580.1 sugar/nucleoside kinase (ribokinase family) [Parabacteroides sp. PH
MKTRELCCIGHITLDKVVTPQKTVNMPGGTAYYFSQAIRYFDDIDFALITAIGASESGVVDDLRAASIDVSVMPSRHSVCFENIYGENQDNRTQRVSAKADPFTLDYLADVNASIIHLGSLLADDFSLDVLKHLSQNGLISIDVQGYLREVRDENVYAIDWADKAEALQYIHFLKANEHEMEVLTGYSDIKSAARQLYDWGVKEVLITLGSMGSVIYDGKTYYQIPAYQPKETVDATGCGDTYVTGYLYKRAKGADINEAGHFAAAMSTLKLERSGPFKGTKEDVIHCMETAEKRLPVI